MAVLTTKARKAIPTGKFGLPEERKYPIPDKAHARNALARASQQVGKTITSAQKQEIDRKAHRELGGYPKE